jgi:hypothetical protein
MALSIFCAFSGNLHKSARSLLVCAWQLLISQMIWVGFIPQTSLIDQRGVIGGIHQVVTTGHPSLGHFRQPDGDLAVMQ